MKINNGGHVFPITEENGANSGECGITLRQYFAAHAPAMPDWYEGILDQENLDTRKIGGKAYIFFKWRWAYADMMIAEGNKS